MPDQAEGLRRMERAQEAPNAPAPSDFPVSLTQLMDQLEPCSRSLVFTSGKGGVGTSNLALNLAIELGRLEQRVLLVDADFGLANLDVLCGLTPATDIGAILTGDGHLADALVDGPEGIRILPGAHGTRTLLEVLGDGPRKLVEELATLDAEADFVIIDAGSGLCPSIGALAGAADEVVVVTTPEPTSMADAQAAIHRFRRLSSPPKIRLLVNQATSKSEAENVVDHLVTDSHQFLGAVVTGFGQIRRDPRVSLAVRERRPFVVAYPGCLAARGVRRLARSLLEERHPRLHRPGFFAAIAARWTSSRHAR